MASVLGPVINNGKESPQNVKIVLSYQNRQLVCINFHMLKTPRLLFKSKTRTGLLLLFVSAFGVTNAQMLKASAVRKTGKTNLEKFLNAKTWNELFPNRYGLDKKDAAGKSYDFYSFEAFVEAAKAFPKFLAEGDEAAQKRELSAFLANIAQETTGGWSEAPGGYFKWGLVYLEEQGHPAPAYIDASDEKYKAVKGKRYYGRGSKQLSWNYNYGQFSEAWYGNKDTLLQHPEYLSTDPVASFASAIWFWMTGQDNKPSCHDVMTGKWKPTADDIKKGRLPGFGATLNIINGGVECGKVTVAQKTKYRYEYYKYFCKYFNVAPGDNIECADQKPFNK
jgi:hypothetical protein